MALSSSNDCTARSPTAAANGGGHCPGQVKVRITIDLVTAARRHLAFLKSLSDSIFLDHAPTILRSIRRYDVLWMPLISRLSKDPPAVPMLLPPLDVRWVWHCHCLSPASYRQYCHFRFGHLVERPAIFDDENEEYASNRCRDMWAAEYPSEPFDLETMPEDEGKDDDGGGLRTDGSSPHAGGDLFAEVARCRSLYSVFSDPFVAETVYLVSARQRYIVFLHLCRRSADGATRMVPTSDTLLMWLTHQSFPGVYARDMEGVMGADDLARRVVGFGERATGEEREETMKIWEQAFDEPYGRAGANFDPAGSVSRVFFHWEEPGAPTAAAADESNRKYKPLQPRSLMEVCVFLKGKWDEIVAKDRRKMFLRLQTVRCNKELKLERSISSFSSVSWQSTWHICCELGTRGVIIELRKHGSNCLGNSKLIKSLVFMWNDLLRTQSLTLTKHLEMQVKALVSVTPPVQAPYLLKCVPDRVTDDKGAMISDVILRMNNYHPQEGRWLTRTVLDHAGRECFVVRIRIGEGFWRRGAETPRPVKWEGRIIEIREGPWSYVASSIGTAPQKVVGTAVPKEKDLEEKKVTWCLSTGDVLRIQWQSGLEFQLDNEDSVESARLVVGRKLQFQVQDACLDNKDYKEQEEQSVTLIRFTQEHPDGRATALLNWSLLAVEFMPEEDAVFILLLCMAVVRTISEVNREDKGHLLMRCRVKEATTHIRDWGSVILPPATSSSVRVKPWFWDPKGALTSAGMTDSTPPMYRYSPADGKDELYKQCIMLSR